MTPGSGGLSTASGARTAHSAGVVHVERSVPYPWPYDGVLDPARLALVVAGWDGAWQSRSASAPAAVQIVVDLAAATAAPGGLVVGVAHHDGEALALPGAQAVTAGGIDAFCGSPLDGVLRRAGRTHLLVAGLGLEGPVHSTLRSANDRGYECLLVTDACAPLQPDLAEAAASMVTMSGGIFGALGRAAEVVAALAAVSHHRPRDPETTT